MIRNYLRLAIRNLTRRKLFGFLNVFGLALGTACCLYILLYVRDEYSYDRHHAAADRLFRVTSVLNEDTDPDPMASSSPQIPVAMAAEFPEVETFTRFVGMFTGNRQLFRYGDRQFYAEDGIYADSTFFELFDYRFVHGSPEDALTEPYHIVLTEPLAQRIFGTANPVGETLKMETPQGSRDVRVTAVISTELGKSHIQPRFLLSMNSGGIGSYALTVDDWVGNNFTNAYVKLRPGASAEALQAKLPGFLERHAGEVLRERNMSKGLYLQPVPTIHTTTKYGAEPSKPVSPKALAILLGIALLIQLIACINFMNLATARATERAREIGVRRVVGAERSALVGQFLTESLLVAFLAMLIAVPLLWFALPTLNTLSGVQIAPSVFFEPVVLGGVLLLGLTSGLLAGSYPAFYLAGFRPVRVLQGKVRDHRGGMSLRRVLVVGQFVLSIGLIVCVIVMNQQLRFIQRQELGYQPEQKIVLNFDTDQALQQAGSFAADIRQLPAVRNASRANNFPSQFVFNDAGFYPRGGSMATATNAQFMLVDEHFVRTLGMELLRGRDFRPADSTGSVIVNEAMLEALELTPEQAVGRRLYSEMSGSTLDLEIVGVMRNFNFNALYSEVTPFLLYYNTGRRQPQLIVDAATTDYAALIGQLRSAWERHLPAVPFEYKFIDEEVAQQYAADQRLARIINGFTLLAILISCLGLFGLATFTATQRSKEVGIRKVLGASVPGLVGLLSREYLKLVALALVVAAPLAWFGLRSWLDQFAYRIQIEWWVFVLAGAAALSIAFLTVSWQALRTALANPADKLRSE